MCKRQLFGGAIELHLPSRFVDVSDFRPVPDNQEVYADGNTDESTVVEVMEHSQAAAGHSTPAEFYFNDLGEANEATDVTLASARIVGSDAAPGLPSDLKISLATGRQKIAKGQQSQDAANTIQILLAVIQMPRVSSDLLITLNLPLFISERSAAAQHAGAGLKEGGQAADELMATILRTVVIKDWSLFGTSA